MIHSYAWQVNAGCCQWCLSLSSCVAPLQAAWVFPWHGIWLPQNKWSKRQTGRSQNIFHELASEIILYFSTILWVQVAQLCPTLQPHGLYSLSGSSVHGISQARILDWITISFSRGSSQPRDWTSLSCIKSTDSLLLSHKGSPYIYNNHVKNKPHLFWIN